MKTTLVPILFAVLWLAAPAMAKTGNAEKGEQIYGKRCLGCHGADGDGLSPAAKRLNPPPRDFASGMYKIKTTGFDDIVPNDEDIFRMIRDGMPGTAMPGWSDVLSDQDMWDLVAYVKTFAGFEKMTPEQQLDYGKQVSSSAESIKRGKELFHESDRCSECHGEQGKGDAIKRLKGDAGERTWPRNLTKPWSFRASSDPKDIFARISIGIPGTEMPSFADPESKKKLSIEDRWHVANYVVSLAKTQETVNPDNTVIKAERIDGEVAAELDDERWKETTPTTFFLVPQILAKERFFTPSNDTITVRAMYNDKDIVFLLEWDDRTKSIPGNEKAEKLADDPIAEDAVAVQLPVSVTEGIEKPYFGMGDAAHPVNIWHWKSGTTNKPEGISLSNSKGFKEIEKREAGSAGIQAKSAHHQGTWRVLMRRPLVTGDKSKDIQFVEGQFIPVAFAAWDGSNSENGSRHTLTTWYWLFLKPTTGAKPFMAALLVMVLIGGGQFWWLRNASGRNRRT